MKRLALHLLLGLVLLVVSASTTTSLAVHKSIRFTELPLEQGDLVFIGADSVFWAKAASIWSKPEHRFGHVGVYAVVRGKPVIVHAGGSPTNGDAPVQAEAAQSYLSVAERVGIYRLKAARPTRERIAQRALDFVAEHAVFDRKFTLADRHRLYCTALAWRAILETTGRDVVPHKSKIAGRTVILLSDLEASSALAQIAFVQTAADFSTPHRARRGFAN